MKPTDILTAFIHFFNDLVAHIIPGLLLVATLAYLLDKFDAKGFQDIHWSIHIAAYYVVGHFLLALHGKLTLLKALKFVKTVTPAINESDVIQQFIALLKNKTDIQSTKTLKFHDIRSIAMSIDPEAGDLGRRFMFITLFCKGIATALLLLAIINICITISTKTCDITSVCSYIASLGLLWATYIFNIRAAEFESRALRAPFPVAIAKLSIKDKVHD